MPSTLAQNFSAALDDMFKLDGLGALELSVEEKYARPVQAIRPIPQTPVLLSTRHLV